MLAKRTTRDAGSGADGETVVVGHILVHAMRLPAPSAWHAHIQGQVIEHGQLVERTSRGGSLDRSFYTCP